MGLGTQDDLDLAKDFVDSFDLTHQMLWDESFQSWAQLGVSLQPSAKLYSADGELLKEWLGPFDEDEVLALIRGSAPAASPPEESADVSDRFCRYVARFARAQVEAASYGAADPRARQRVVDDLRYAANAMAQTATGETQAAAGELAAAVRDYVQVIIDAGLPDTLVAGDISTEAAALRTGLETHRSLLATTCGVELEATPVPALD